MPQCRRDQKRFAQLLLSIVVVESVLVIIVMTWEHRHAELVAEEKRQQQQETMAKDIVDGRPMEKELIAPDTVPKVDSWSEGNHWKRKDTADESNVKELRDGDRRLMDGRIKALDLNSYNARQDLAAAPYQPERENERKDDELRADENHNFAVQGDFSNDAKNLKSSILLSIFKRNNKKELNSDLHAKRLDWRGSML